ncbi:MAG: PhoH family protein [Lachnospiraceae bacterium]|nr:PhoH family protein [Lachnospiraceae bacterium]MDD6685973.1 PhoH family protein [Lachnospiraceae bacterium]MDD7049151.1 PhoH family protein [Lachnospiraceae bacterium]
MNAGIIEEQIELPGEHERNVFGQFDQNIKKIERTLQVSFVSRDGNLKITGPEGNVRQARECLEQLVELSRRGNEITEQNINYILSLAMEHNTQAVVELDGDYICHTVSGRPVKPKTLGQKRYVDAIRQHMITFGIGPAGTGKTYLAMAMAITAFRNDEVSRIILTRPAIEAGEKLGFLPGDLQSKIDPYLRPLYDALHQIMGAEAFQKNMEKGLIEVAPLAYMRGRTLDNAYIILDEAQNTTPAQMKMFLTRIGFGSKVIVTGDMTQKDLGAGTVSGLDVAVRVLKRVEGIAFCELTSRDVVRHPLVQKIVEAYEGYEKKAQAQADRKKKRRKGRP